MTSDNQNFVSELEALFDTTAKTQFVVPGLETIHPGWKMERHKDYDRLKEDLNVWCNKWWIDPRIRAMLDALDAAHWTAMSYPNVAYDKLLIIGQCLAWIFVWDDAIDDGKFTHDTTKAIQYQNETIDFMNGCFEKQQDTLALKHPDPAIEAFKDFAYEIKQHGHPVTATRFLEEIRAWVIFTAECQKKREDSQIPTPEEYLHRRSINVGFHPYTVLVEYGYNVVIPDRLWKQNASMASVWYHSALVAAITNDIVSLAKELEVGQYESWIPLIMFHRGLNLQDAMDSATKMIRDYLSNIVREEQVLLEESTGHPDNELRTFLLGIRHIVLCCLHHPYSSQRYLRCGQVQADGSILFKVQAKHQKPELQ